MISKKEEEQILREIRDVDNRLSPENLHHDGEIPIDEVRKEEKRLTKLRQTLVKKLGREPTDLEIYGF